MNEMTDSDLDVLILQTMQRRALLTDLDQLIIADVRRRERRAWLRRWARVVAFSFGLPLVLLIFFACAYIIINERGATSLTLYVMPFPTLALFYAARYAVCQFSPGEV